MSDRDRVKLLKPDNKQLGRKTAARILHIKSRFCILLSLFLTTLVLVTLFNNKLQLQSQSLHQYVRGFFDPRNKPANMMHEIVDENDNFELLEHNDDFDLVWEDDTIAMFQDHLGLVVDEDSKVEQCHLAERQVAATALPGPNNEDLYEALWQFISLFALQAQTLRVDDYGRKFTLKAFVTEQMRIMLDQLFEGYEYSRERHTKIEAINIDISFLLILGIFHLKCFPICLSHVTIYAIRKSSATLRQ